MEFVPNHAPYVALAFLGTGFVGFVGTVLIVFALLGRRWEAARKIVIALIAISCVYGATVLAFSFASNEKTLKAGERKYFCEVDCHLAYSIIDVQTAKTLGAGEKQVTATGKFYVVTVQTYFDEKTISPKRGNGLLHPNLRTIQMVDDSGTRYEASLEGLRVLDVAAEKMVPLDQSLRPGEKYESTFVFDLPESAKNPRLWLTDPDPALHMVIGHENSLFHKKVYFAVEAGKQEASVQQRATAGRN